LIQLRALDLSAYVLENEVDIDVFNQCYLRSFQVSHWIIKIASILVAVAGFYLVEFFTNMSIAVLFSVFLVLGLIKCNRWLSNQLQINLPSYKRAMKMRSIWEKKTDHLKRKVCDLESQYGFFNLLYPLLRNYDESLNDFTYYTFYIMLKDHPERVSDDYEYYIDFLKIGQELLYQNKVDVFDTIQHDETKH